MNKIVLFLATAFAILAMVGCQRAKPLIVAPAPTEVPSPTPTFTPALFLTPTPVLPTPPLPSPTPTTQPTATPLSSEVEYVVQPGDNLFRIALRFGTTVEAIKEANGLTNDIIYVGQVLIIPTPGEVQGVTVYVVQSGDTLFRIALRYGTTVEAIMEANGLSDTTIYAGQELVIP